MGDVEFLQAVKIRIQNRGLVYGLVGNIDGPNCLLGTAGYVEHGTDLTTVDNKGIEIILNGRRVRDVRESVAYEQVPGMVRLARLLGFNSVREAYQFNDDYKNRSADHAAVIARIDEAIARLEAEAKTLQPA